MHQIINQSDEKLFRERFIIFFSFTHGVKMRHLISASQISIVSTAFTNKSYYLNPF